MQAILVGSYEISRRQYYNDNNNYRTVQYTVAASIDPVTFAWEIGYSACPDAILTRGACTNLTEAALLSATGLIHQHLAHTTKKKKIGEIEWRPIITENGTFNVIRGLNGWPIIEKTEIMALDVIGADPVPTYAIVGGGYFR